MLLDFTIVTCGVLLRARHYANSYENLSLILAVTLKNRSFYPYFRHDKIESREIK